MSARGAGVSGTPIPNKDARVGGKRRWSLMPLDVFGAIIDVMQWAIERETPPPYERDSWRDLVAWRELYSEALLRHMTAWQSGEERDSESGMLHVAHMGACAAILIARSIENNPAKLAKVYTRNHRMMGMLARLQDKSEEELLSTVSDALVAKQAGDASRVDLALDAVYELDRRIALRSEAESVKDVGDVDADRRRRERTEWPNPDGVEVA